MANFKATAPEVKEGWPKLEGENTYLRGPLYANIAIAAKIIKRSGSQKQRTQTSALLLVPHFLQSLPRLPEERGKVKHGKVARQWYSFCSLLSLAQDSPGTFPSVAAAVAASSLESLARIWFTLVQGEVGSCVRVRGKKEE